jgi:hypothetical protein
MSNEDSRDGLGLAGRGREVTLLTEFLREGEGVRLLTLRGPRGSGKTQLIRGALASEEFASSEWEILHFEGVPLTSDDLLADFAELTRRVLGGVPRPRRARSLPLESGERNWPSLLSGLVDHVERTGRRMVLVLDGLSWIHQVRRRLPGELGEMIDRARGRKLPLTLLLVARSEMELRPFSGSSAPLGIADLEMALHALPFRVAGWGHGGRNPRDAFLRWAILGDDPSHLPFDPPEEELEESVARRVLLPDGDLFDAPLRRLEAAFQKPGRYAAILRALASGALEWADLLAGARGIESGGQLSPYLHRLEEEGMIRAESPLDTRVGSRGKRYAIVDPFMAFWFRSVLPRRSLLTRGTARDLWRREIFPELSTHFQSQMEEASRRWLRDHVSELFGVEAREAGALWGEGAEFPVAGLLANGQVCYGLVDWEVGTEDPVHRVQSLLQRTRYGIGREARIPLFFLAQEGGETFRRMTARDPLARVVDLAQLMGPDRP